MIDHLRDVTGLPVVTGLPFGHVPEIATLPFGGQARLVAQPDGFTLTMSDYPHLS